MIVHSREKANKRALEAHVQRGREPANGAPSCLRFTRRDSRRRARASSSFTCAARSASRRQRVARARLIQSVTQVQVRNRRHVVGRLQTRLPCLEPSSGSWIDGARFFFKSSMLWFLYSDRVHYTWRRHPQGTCCEEPSNVPVKHRPSDSRSPWKLWFELIRLKCGEPLLLSQRGERGMGENWAMQRLRGTLHGSHPRRFQDPSAGSWK